jgi:hypothetical protein
MKATEALVNILISIVIALILIVAFAPDWVGHWEAQRDIAYDSIWSEWVSDCDCTQPLE